MLKTQELLESKRVCGMPKKKEHLVLIHCSSDNSVTADSLTNDCYNWPLWTVNVDPFMYWYHWIW